MKILFFTLTTALDILEVADIPDNLTLSKYLNSIDNNKVKNIVDNTVETISQGQIIEDRTEQKVQEDLIEINDNIIETETPQEVLSSNDCYYEQLNDVAKKMYTKLYNNKENLKTGTYTVEFGNDFSSMLDGENGAQNLELSFQAALNALIYDKPEMFYIDITKMYLYTETTTFVMKKSYKVSIGPENGGTYLADGFDNKEQVNQAINQIDKKIEDLSFSISGSDYNKIKMIHNYLVDNISYDQTISKPNIYNIYGALINGECVCEGYAKSFKYIMDKLGIDSIFIFGTAINSKGEQENHAWNYVKLSGKMYAVDTTWDDPIIIGGGILNDSLRYKYFLKGSNEFNSDHTEDGKALDGIAFTYPRLSANNY